MGTKNNLTRRAFLAATTTTATAVVTGCTTTNTAKVVPGKISPNEKVVVGLIGLGGRCREIARNCLDIPEIEIAAVCDCFRPRVNSALKNLGKGNGYIDFRTMIEKENLDGVMVETTTHARAWVACHAMAMGMDAYIEKPMSLTIAEGRHMVDVARKYKRVTQIGTQQRSIPLNNWASDLVLNGELGKIKEVHAPNFVGALRWEKKPAQKLSRGGDDGWWDIWTNQAEYRDYHEELHRRWNQWWPYDGGGQTYGVTGWGAHSYDQVNRGLGMYDEGPVEIVLEEALKTERTGKWEERTPGPDETGQAYYRMADQTGPRAKVNMTFRNGVKFYCDMDGDKSPGLGCQFHCENGMVEINRDRIWSEPQELTKRSDRPETLKVAENEPHIRNWMDCIRTRETCTADIEFAQRSSTLCYLVNIAREVGKVGEALKWNDKKERFTNCEEGNALLSRPRRPGWELPA